MRLFKPKFSILEKTESVIKYRFVCDRNFLNYLYYLSKDLDLTITDETEIDENDICFVMPDFQLPIKDGIDTEDWFRDRLLMPKQERNTKQMKDAVTFMFYVESFDSRIKDMIKTFGNNENIFGLLPNMIRCDVIVESNIDNFNKLKEILKGTKYNSYIN